MSKRVLLGHLNSNGDCLFATVIARQIKGVDHPGCHLTWAVSSKCKQSVLLNPYVDDIWEVPTANSMANVEEWNSFVAEVDNRKDNGEFDQIYLTQIFAENWFNFDGGIRSSIYNNYQHPITVPHQPVIQLSDTEVENVKIFAENHNLAAYKQIILVECGADSFEAALNPQSAYKFAQELTAENKDVAVILSSNRMIESEKTNIIDGSELTFRENAEITKYCNLFIGVASGISWLTTTNWAQKLNTVLIIDQTHVPMPSMIFDHDYFQLSTDHIIEIKSNENALKKLKDCLNSISTKGFGKSRSAFNEQIVVEDFAFLYLQLKDSLSKFELGKFFSCLDRCVSRNGISMIFSRHFIKIIWDLQLAFVNKLLLMSGLKKKTNYTK